MAAPGASRRQDTISINAPMNIEERLGGAQASRLMHSSQYIIRESTGVARGHDKHESHKLKEDGRRGPGNPSDWNDDDESRLLRCREIAPQPHNQSKSAVVVRRANDLQYHDNSFNGSSASTGRAAIAPAAAAGKLQSEVNVQVADKQRGRGGGRRGNGRRAELEQERLGQRSHCRQRNSSTNINNESQHHYECCTDSDLVSAVAQPPLPHHFGANANFRVDNFNYDQNILLFATGYGAASGSQQPAVLVALDEHSNSNPNSNSNPSKLPNRSIQLGATGKFVSHYPTYASSTQPSLNYSFHVPLKTGSGHFRRHLHSTADPATIQAPIINGRSRTMAYLQLICPDSSSDEPAKCDLSNSNCYEDFYERPESSNETRRLNCRQYMMLSEGDLLRIRQQQNPMSLRRQVEQDVENPFRPGTELSWEADLMVRLIQRGYPIQELPQLVAAAKEVADGKSVPSTNNTSTNMCRSGTLPANVKLQANFSKQPARGKSVCDLSLSGKRAWANSLQRAKSMPRVLRYNNDSSSTRDDDSLDRLITSIEREISCSLAELKSPDKSESKATNRKESSEPIRADETTKAIKKKTITTVGRDKKQRDCCAIQ